MTDYFNTVPVTGEQLKLFEAKAKSQNEAVLQLFKKYKKLSPSECWALFNNSKLPITSIRRAISILTNGVIKNRESSYKDCLRMTGEKKTGLFGSPENIWEITEKGINFEI